MKLLAVIVLAFSALHGQERAGGIERVGFAPVPHPVGDIWVHRGFAYLGGSECGRGVTVIDVGDPAAPVTVATLPALSNATYEDVAVIRSGTAAFQGDLLVVGVQPRCGGQRSENRGFEFWDVTNPRDPTKLAFLPVGSLSGVHELHVFERDGRILVAGSVPSSDASPVGEIRLVDASDPAQPRLLSRWDPIEGFGLQPELEVRGQIRSVYCHSVTTNREGTRAYLSYWDAGLIILDIQDLEKPVYLGRIQYDGESEGNTHSAWPVPGDRLLLVADEDYSPGGSRVEVTDPPSLSGTLVSLESPASAPLCQVGEVSGTLEFVGQACNALQIPSSVRGNIAGVETGGCALPVKIAILENAGASAIVLIGLSSILNESRLPIVAITAADGKRLAEFAGTVRLKISPPAQQTWGFLRIFDISSISEPRELAQFATGNTRKCPAPDAGTYTVHNPVVAGDVAFLSWYSDGVRAIDLSNPEHPREVGWFVPEDRRVSKSARQAGKLHEGEDIVKTSIWGVYVEDDLIFASDINAGLYILRRTPVESPSTLRSR